MTLVIRVPALQPLSPAQLAAVKILADGWSYDEGAQLMGVTYGTFVGHINDAAHRLPGTFPPRLKCVAWWRGATAAVLGAAHQRPTRSTTLSEATTIYGGRACPYCGNVANSHADQTSPDG